MAKAASKTARTDKGDKVGKKAKKKPAAGVGKSAKAGRKASDDKKTRRAKPQSERHSALEALARLADHPMIGDLLAAGAVAAVAAIAEQQLDRNRPASSKIVKSAGKAAAAAIGKKLMGEFGAIKEAATEAAKKA